MSEDANNPQDEDRAENVLADIDSQRLKTIRETNEKAFKEGNKFSMSRMQTLDQQFSKFEITGLDDDEKSSQPETKSDFIDPSDYLSENPEPGSLSDADMAIRTAFNALPEPDQNAIIKSLPKVDRKSAEFYLKADWKNICGGNDKVEREDLIKAFSEDGLSGTDRASVLFLMINYDHIQTTRASAD